MVKGQRAGTNEGERTRSMCNYNEVVESNPRRAGKKNRDYDRKLRALSDKRALDKRITGGRFKSVRLFGCDGLLRSYA